MNYAQKTRGLLVCHRVRVQNANCISSPMTWGFPSMTSFLGLMWALERKLNGTLPILLNSVGVVCHSFEPQITTNRYEKAFHLTRNPLTREGDTPAICEEGRAHIEVTLIFGVDGGILDESEEERSKAAHMILKHLSAMRIAGGTIVPTLRRRRQTEQVELTPLSSDRTESVHQFAKLRRKLIPGFALVSREDLLAQRHSELKEKEELSDQIDAWLDFSRITYHAKPAEENMFEQQTVAWEANKKKGWVIPIPVGYCAVSNPYEPGKVSNARDKSVYFQFVESLYSVGEWIAPHRLTGPEELLWYAESDLENGTYMCRNDYALTLQETTA